MVHIEIKEEISLNNPYGDSVVFIAFTGNATGMYYTGEVVPGGVDTQSIEKHGDRYYICKVHAWRELLYRGKL